MRYFGGTKLGVPGLIAAYKESAAEVLAAARIVQRTVDRRIAVTFSYAAMNDIMRIVKEEQPAVESQRFDQSLVDRAAYPRQPRRTINRTTPQGRRSDHRNMNEPKSIHIKGARVHNLRNIEVEIPHDTLTVITGLSGSGKSTLAFDTIFAEGQRRYVESLSAYARQFLGKIDKPDVDLITGIAPAIAIEQKVNTRNPRSTVGTTTEIYDYLKLLFARIGRTFSPVSGREVKCYDVDDVAQYVLALGQGAKALVAAPLVAAEGQGVIEKLTLLMGDGIQRVQYDGRTRFIEELLPELDPAVRPTSCR